MKTLTTLILLLCSLSTQAAKDPYHIVYADLHIGSIHQHKEFDKGGKHYSLNQFNYGGGITYPMYHNITGDKVNVNASYRAGVYKNSYNATSVYLGVDFHTKYTNGFGVGVMTGFVSGYKKSPRNTDIVAAVVPHVHYIYNKYKAEIGYLHSPYSPALTLTISYRF